MYLTKNSAKNFVAVISLMAVLSACAPAAADNSVPADTLFNDYKSNAQTADAKYKDKTILIKGTVLSTDTGIYGDPVLHVKAGADEYADFLIMIFKPENKEEIDSLTAGQPIKVECLVSGVIGSTTDANLENCVIKEKA